MGYQALSKGARISEYVLVEKLGQGGFGEVWKAEHCQIPGKFVAIKVPTKPESMDLLHKEAVFQHQLEHPNIVRTIGLDTRHDPPYFMMEFVEGRNLRQFMQQEGILPPPYAIDVAVQVLEALSYAHARGIIHKDVKPENILVERKRVHVGKDHKAYLHYVKITDLGLGKMPDGAKAAEMVLSANSRTSGVRTLTGTLFYSAPEQMSASRDADARSDLYSVGVVLYEMLTGELPLGMDLPSELNPVVTERLNRICKKALSIDPDQRYRSAREMADELIKAKEDLLVRLAASGAPAAPAAHDAGKPAKPPAVKAEAAAPPRPSRTVRALEWGLLGLVVALLAVSAYAYLRPRTGNQAPPPSESGPRAPGPLGPLHFESAPAGAALLVNGEHSYTTPCDLQLPFERHQILVTRDFYEPRLLALEPREADGRRRFALVDERTAAEISVKDCEQGASFDRLELVRQKGRLTIRTPGLTQVAVHLNSEPVGTTPYEDEVPAGVHNIRLMREGYQTFEFEITIASGAPVVRELALVPVGAVSGDARHPVTFTTQPPGATLYIEGVRQTQATPCTVELPSGVCRLRLEMAHHEPCEERITIGGPVTLPYTLARIRGRVELESDPSGAEVFLDGRRIGKTPFVDFVEGGPHSAEFRLAGHFPNATNFSVIDKTQSVCVKTTMQRIPPGTLVVDSEIKGVEIFVDGRAAGRAPLAGLRIEPGKHRVRAMDVEREVEAEAGAERKILFSLKDLRMALVPAGPFEYGCPPRDVRPPDLPARQVELNAFYVDLYEVTNEQYTAFLEVMRRTNDHSRCDPNEGPNKDHTPAWWEQPDMKEFHEARRPVVGVDYYDAHAYAAWAGKRLPTEEEWEKAARGTDARRYPWGNNWREDEKRCNWFDYKGEKDGYGDITAPVGSFEAGRSPYGCHDMAGNVWEWTSSSWNTQRSASRTVRGGCYLDKNTSYVWSRDGQPPNQKEYRKLGFRCVASAK